MTRIKKNERYEIATYPLSIKDYPYAIVFFNRLGGFWQNTGWFAPDQDQGQRCADDYKEVLPNVEWAVLHVKDMGGKIDEYVE
jgi:hypothetical protein